MLAKRLPPCKIAAWSVLAKRLPHLIEEGMRLGPSKRTNPVGEVQRNVMGWRWTANWSGERSWVISSVLEMLPVVPFAFAGQGLTAVTRHHFSVALNVDHPMTTTTTIDELMGKLRTKLSLQGVIGHHAPAVTVQGMISQLSSAKIDVIELKRGLANGMRRAYVSFAKPVSHSSTNLDETPLGPRMQINDNLLNGPQSKSAATLTTSSKLPESGYPEKSIAMIEKVDTRQMYAFDVAHWEAYGFKDSFPFAATKYNQTPEVACCLPCWCHGDSDLKANLIIGNRTWLMSPVDVRSGQIGRWLFRFLDKPALVGSQWRLTFWKLAAQMIEAMLPRGTARHQGVQASMTWREETGSFQSMQLHPTQVTYAMKHNYDKYPPSKNQFKDARARRCMRHKRMRQATDGYGGCILGDGFLTTSFGDAAALAISTSEASVTGPVKVCLWPLLISYNMDLTEGSIPVSGVLSYVS
ncbi:hypothetical protein BU17DRAFT_93644 [Hysterangium stoloniferum]|nr:hypothetical protein BU17DRAFT_93644 [Hysterangium stoloniferum]